MYLTPPRCVDITTVKLQAIYVARVLFSWICIKAKIMANGYISWQLAIDQQLKLAPLSKRLLTVPILTQEPWVSFAPMPV